MTEEDFQLAVMDLAAMLGLRVWHDNDSRRNKAGLPDLIIVGRRGVLWRELKSAKGRVRPEQQAWLSELVAAGQDARVWRPAHLSDGTVLAELRGVR